VDVLVLDTIQESHQIYHYKSTGPGLSGWIMVGNASVFSREGFLYYTDLMHNIALKPENIRHALHEISLNGYYRLTNDQFGEIKKTYADHNSFSLAELNPTRYDKATSYIEIDSGNKMLSQAHKELASCIYFNHVKGRGGAKNTHAKDIPVSRVYLPNPAALAEITREGAVLFLCNMSLLSNNFYTCMRDPDDKKTYVRAVRKTQKIQADREKQELNAFFKQILANPDHYLRQVDEDLMGQLFRIVDSFWNSKTPT
jgi:hypothetical protein